MSIFPATDLVIDVGLAADPSRKAEALKHLEKLSFSTDVSASNSELPIPYNTHSSNRLSVHNSKSNLSTSPNVASGNQDSHVLAFKKFEAFILQTWLEILLPNAGSGAYGNDQAGSLWRSFMAEQLGDQLSKNDSLGLSRLALLGPEHDAEALINK